MILDAQSLELVNAIEALLEPAPLGDIKPRADGVGPGDLDGSVRRR